jgi:hypothetical protein
MEQFRCVHSAKYSYNNNCELLMSGEFWFNDIEQIDCYDKEGNFLFIVERTNNRQEHRENVLVRDFYQVEQVVFQRKFEFKVAEILSRNTVEDLQKIPLSYPFEVAHYTDYYSVINKEYNQNKSFKELSMFGSQSYGIHNNIGKGVLDFDVQKYKLNLKKFCKENPELESEAQRIFNANIELLALFFDSEKDSVESGKMDIKKGMFNRMKYKIKSKTEQINRRQTRR